MREAYDALKAVLAVDDDYVEEANDLRAALAELSKVKNELTFALADANGKGDKLTSQYRQRF